MNSRPPAARRDSPVQVVDFFSGCGGMSYGFVKARTRNVRFLLKGALDIDRYANETYGEMLGVEPICADIREFDSPAGVARLRESWGLDTDLPSIVIGCAPCQGFSSHRKKDARTDDRNSLLEVFGRIAKGLKPDVVLMENVPEVLHASHWKNYKTWHDTLRRAGYVIRAQIHNLAQFGVPQERFRAVVIAARDWKYFRMPKGPKSPWDYVTVRQAIGHLPRLKASGIDPHDQMHITSRHRKETIDLIRLIPVDGGSRRSLPAGVGPKCLQRVDGFRDVYGRLAWDKPSVAITARCRTPSCGRYIHPEQHRGLSVREAALLQGFPAQFFFEGPFDDKFKQIGNAVSPIFSRALARHLDREWILSHDRKMPDGNWHLDITEPITKSFSSSIAGIKRRANGRGHAHPMVRL